MRLFYCFTVCIFFWGNICFALEPDEILNDPELENRARVISEQLRCLVCRNENIDNSDAELAKDLRVLVRERLTSGDTNEEIFSFLIERYGSYILLKPKFTGSGIILWLISPFLILFGGLFVGIIFWRQKNFQRPRPEPYKLSKADRELLNEFLEDE